jgi:hypothetical protein
MTRARYHFVTTWRVIGPIELAADILSDARDLPRWWPAVYLDVRIVEPGDVSGVGRLVELYTKGWLPYTLRWSFRVTEARSPHGFSLAAEGDFIGVGIWELVQAGNAVVITYTWSIEAKKPLLRVFSPLLRPVFAANHRWAMATGERSLQLEIYRRQAQTDAERAAVPPPPGPTWPTKSPRQRTPETV